jgi:hypothetical protein
LLCWPKLPLSIDSEQTSLAGGREHASGQLCHAFYWRCCSEEAWSHDDVLVYMVQLDGDCTQVSREPRTQLLENVHTTGKSKLACSTTWHHKRPRVTAARPTLLAVQRALARHLHRLTGRLPTLTIGLLGWKKRGVGSARPGRRSTEMHDEKVNHEPGRPQARRTMSLS